MNLNTSSLISAVMDICMPTPEARLKRSYHGYSSLCSTKSLLVSQIPAALRDDLLAGIRFVQYEPSKGAYNHLPQESMDHTTRLEHIHNDDLKTFLERFDKLGLGGAVY